MVGSSKILTVSYGTFSCTLEGFDDSFSTMKAISEYFRDLAADDRYFGAEPPTPDAEMLARIAEREISRRVEARTGDNGTGIVLRAATSLTDQTSGAAAAPVQETEAAPAPAPEAPAPAAPVADAAPVSDAAADDAGPAMPPAATPPVEAAPLSMPEAAVSAPSADDEDTAVEAEVEADNDALTFADMAPVADAAEIPAHPDAESVAAKLQRIRAVVGKADAAPVTEAFAEDQDAAATEGFEAEVDEAEEMEMPEVDAPEAAAEEAEMSMDMDAAEDEASANDAMEVAEEAEVEAEVEVEAEAEAEVEVEAAAEAEADMEAAAEIEAADEAAVESAIAPKPAVRARIVRLRKDTLSAELKTEPTPEAADAAPEADTAAEDDSADVADDDLIANVLGAQPEDDDQDDTAFADDLDAGAEDLAAAEDLMDIAALDGVDELKASDMDDSSDLSPEDEAELMQELAEVEAEQADDAALSVAEMADGVLGDLPEDEVAQDDSAPEVSAEDSIDAIEEAVATAEDASDEKEANAPAASEPRQGRDILPENDDAAMSRIMTQTDEALSEPEGSRRRNAIAQLKAAVAATEAARQLGDQNTQKAETESAFREDLEDAVRPKRPARPTRPEVSEEPRTARPRPAPLKLVASQRIDAPEPAADAAPVQPRRVAMAAEAAATDAGSFAEFAEEMGATELPDLLEAAAAYTAFVEGVEDFSRPQIMKKVQLTTDQEFSREDGLRSFGTLLRQGRISKVRNGRFQVSEQTRFRPEQRAG